jgi:hypothetical protein
VTDRHDLLLALARAVARQRAGAGPEGLCRAAVALLGADGGSVTCAPAEPAGATVCATDEVAARLADLEEVVGDGPAVRAFREGRPVTAVLGADTPVPASLAAFGAVAAGIPGDGRPLVVRAWPVRAARGPVAVLAVHGAAGSPDGAAGPEGRDGPGGPGTDPGQVLADALAPALLGAPEPSGEGPVQRAVGMVVAQTGRPPHDAHALLRARAWAEGVRLADVAADVLDRRTAFGGR